MHPITSSWIKDAVIHYDICSHVIGDNLAGDIFSEPHIPDSSLSVNILQGVPHTSARQEPDQKKEKREKNTWTGYNYYVLLQILSH